MINQMLVIKDPVQRSQEKMGLHWGPLKPSQGKKVAYKTALICQLFVEEFQKDVEKQV